MKTYKANIFIVEDDRFFGNIVKEVLSDSNYRVVKLFSSGEECIEHIHECPDIVILDHHLGKMDGIDVLRKIKGVNPNIQVIFLSAQEKLNVAIKSLKYGAYDYLEKNTSNLHRLVHLVHRIVQSNIVLKENRNLKIFKMVFLISYGVFVCAALTFYLYVSNIFI